MTAIIRTLTLFLVLACGAYGEEGNDKKPELLAIKAKLAELQKDIGGIMNGTPDRTLYEGLENVYKISEHFGFMLDSFYDFELIGLCSQFIAASVTDLKSDLSFIRKEEEANINPELIERSFRGIKSSLQNLKDYIRKFRRPTLNTYLELELIKLNLSLGHYEPYVVGSRADKLKDLILKTQRHLEQYKD